MLSPFTSQYQLLTPTVKSHLETLVTLYTDMAQRTLDTLQSLSELNLQLGRDLVTEAGANCQRLMASKDASQLGAAVSAQLVPGAAALQTYQRGLADVLSRSTSNLAQTASSHMPAVRRSANAMAEEFVHQASQQTARATESMSQYHAASRMRH
jgi:phasin family protein